MRALVAIEAVAEWHIAGVKSGWSKLARFQPFSVTPMPVNGARSGNFYERAKLSNGS